MKEKHSLLSWIEDLMRNANDASDSLEATLVAAQSDLFRANGLLVELERNQKPSQDAQAAYKIAQKAVCDAEINLRFIALELVR